MDRAKKLRTPIRTRVTKLCNEVDTELATPVPCNYTLAKLKVKLSAALEELPLKDADVFEAMVDELKPDQEIEKEDEDCEEYKDKMRAAIEAIEQAIPSQDSIPGLVRDQQIKNSEGHRSYKLPKIELPKFNGDLKSWLGWWSQFEKIHLDKNIHNSDKFQYLLQATEPKSDARDMVSVYPPTGDNYLAAIESLKRRYGREGLQLQVYLRELLNLVVANVTNKEKIPLEKLYMKLDSHLRALKTLDLSKAEPSLYFYPLVESSLPEEVLRIWKRNVSPEAIGDQDRKSKLDDLMEFIKKEVEGEQEIHLAQNAFQDKKNTTRVRVSRNRFENDLPTSQSLFSTGSENSCLLCDKQNHQTQDCFKARNMSIEERVKKIQDSRGCFRCLKRGHTARFCNVQIKCPACGGKHYPILCRGNSENQELVDTTAATRSLAINQNVACTSYSNQDGLVLMKTVQADIIDGRGQKRRIRMLFDEGANRSYIKTATAESLKCPVMEEFVLETTLFGGQTTASKRKRKFKVTLSSVNSKFKDEFLLINEDVICGQCPTIPKGPWIQELKEQRIRVYDSGSSPSEIEILIGSNLWGKLMTGRMYKLKSGLVAVESVFGWTLSGELPSIKSNEQNYASTVISMLTLSEKTLPDLWQLETLGIDDPVDKLTQEEHDDKVMVEFKKNITRVDGRYQVKLPWIDRRIPLPSNRGVCEKRLMATTRKLEHEDLYNTYNKVFVDWEKEGIIERSREGNVPEHYLPHHRVLKLESKTTPVRPVFDASCKVGHHPSLNECLERGPNLLTLIPSILLRFREKDVGVISDIRKAFQMIAVEDEDKNYQKFLWWEDRGLKILKTYRHTRVVFGMICSPFALAAVLHHHLDQVTPGEQHIAEKLRNSLYVDNSVCSFDTTDEYLEFKRVTIAILAEARMDLREWESNMDTDFAEDFESTRKETPSNITNVLGLQWNKVLDTLSVNLHFDSEEDMKITKRTVLSMVAKIYDPIGFTAPATIQPKLLLQSSWAEKMGWDQEWEKDQGERFRKWYQEIDELCKIRVPRIAIGSHTRVQLHLFSDASKDAYAAVVFARVQYGESVNVQLLLAKSRLAPMSKKKDKRATIPRLELLSCFIGARLLNTVKESVKGEEIYCWSDSTTALAWIHRNEDWGTFVGNRVREINQLSEKKQWRHVPGLLNPADLPSRGCSPVELRQSKWWQGPAWLYQNADQWPHSEEQTDEEVVAVEKRKSAMVNVTLNEEPRFSSYWKTIRVAAWVRRYITNLRSEKVTRVRSPSLKQKEIRLGERDVLYRIQTEHFSDRRTLGKLHVYLAEDGLLHLQTRLSYSENPEIFKFPIILPSSDTRVIQLIDFVHKIYGHAGTQFVLNRLRERYWITQGRRTVDKVIRKCVTCKRFQVKPLNSDPAPLPALRVDTQCAFETTGVDLAGPLGLKGGKKAWVVIYTCAVYRGVYLDVIDSISADEFLNSLHKFTCNIGRPTTMFSDNGTNFVGSQAMMKILDWKKLEEKLHVKQIQWKFNPPTAAWWGGWWERLIRSLKDLLRRMIGSAKLTRKELETCMAEISYVMNNRPLTTLTENEEDLIPLTPTMFMRDLPLSGLPEMEKMTSRNFQDAHRKLSAIKVALKSRFRKEYLGNMVQHRSERKTLEPKVGDVVLIGSDNKKRYEWPLGRILELMPGKDGITRVVKLKTKNGVFLRPIQRLYPLEVSEDIRVEEEKALDPKGTNKNMCEEEKAMDPKGTNKNTCEEEKVVTTKSGRRVNKPQRYGQWFN